MPRKVQSDFKFERLLGERGDTLQTFEANATIPDTVEFAFVEPSAGAFNLTFPEVVNALSVDEDVVMTRQLIILGDSNLSTNNVTLLPNGSGITLAGESSFVMDQDNQKMIWLLVDDRWVILANTDESAAFGAMGFTDNDTDTVILNPGELTDIGGTIISGDLKGFTFSNGILTSSRWRTREYNISVNFSLKKALGASAREIRAALLIDTGSGFIEQGSAPMDMDNNLKAFGFSTLKQLSLSDRFKFQIENITNTDAIKVVTYNVGVFSI